MPRPLTSSPTPPSRPPSAASARSPLAPRPARLGVLACALALASALAAQTPQPVSAPGYVPLGADGAEAARLQPCAGNEAGTLLPGPATAQSNDLTLETLFLCFGDEILIDHNGDQRLDGDPDPSTPAGVGYAFYDRRPTVDGPTLGAVSADPGLIANPTPPAGSPPFFVATGGRLDGDILFANTGALQTLFNGGNAVQLWFAPITFDRLGDDGAGNTFPVYENGGSCVSVNTDAAFSVVYLDQLSAGNLQVDNCRGTFDVDGGLPGWRTGERYEFAITNVADPAITGSVSNPDVVGGGTVSFTVPEAGTYRVEIRDEKSCTTTDLIADMTACTPADEVKVYLDTVLAAPGSTVCVPMRVEGFTDIVGFSFGVDYDEVLLRFDRIDNVNISNFGPANYNDIGTELIISGDNFVSPYVVPDGDALFDLCFEVLGLEGEFAALPFFEDLPGGGRAEIASFGGPLDYTLCAGGVVITTNTLALLLEQDGFGCGGEDENFFTGRVLGGTAPYDITWAPTGGGPALGNATTARESQPFVTAANLAPGSYDVTVTDANGVTAVAQITIADGAQLGVFIERISELRCFGDVNGALFAVPTLNFTRVDNPGGDYNFSWDSGQATQGINGLGVGNYVVTVTDARGCTATTDNTITAPSPLDVDLAVSPATCLGVSDGEIVVTATGGTPDGADYTFSYTDPTGAVTDVVTNNLTIDAESGAYLVTVVDDNGCRETASADVGASREIGLTSSITEITCAGETDGEITVVAAATLGTANPPFQFTWLGSGGAVNTPTQSTLPDLGQGVYEVVAQDADGCEARGSYTLVEPTQVQVGLVDSGDESCDPGMDGFVEVTASGGRAATTGYRFDWRDAANAAVASAARADGLTGGTYQVTVTDESGCEATLASPVTIDAPDRPSLIPVDDNRLDCNGDADGVLTVTATAGGSPIDRIEWTGGRTGATITDLPAGTYEVAVFDVAGCVTRDVAEVVEPDALTVDDATLVNPPCFEQGDGSITLEIAGGTAPFTFTWSDGTTGEGENAISGASITAGTYAVSVVDANGCPALEESFTLDNPAGIDPDPSAFVAASCAAGTADGGLTVEATLASDPAATFLFTWSSGESGTGVSSTATMLPGGLVSVQIQESSQVCPPQEFSFEIPAPDPLVLDLGVQEDARCNGEASGRLVVDDVIGGTPGFTYAWTYDGQTFVGPELNDIPATDVALEVRDANGCLLAETFTIDEPAPLVVGVDALGTLEPTCGGSDDGVISVDAAGGNDGQAYAYRWSDDPNRDAPVARDVPAGTYSVIVTDFKGCNETVDVTLTEPDPVVFDLADFADIRCFGDLTTIRLESVSGGSGVIDEDYRVSVNGSSFQPVDQTFQVPGGVVVPITVIDPSECAAEDEVLIPAPPAITVRLPETLEVELGDSIRLRPDVFPGGAPLLLDSITWTPDTTISFRNGNLADPYVSPLVATTYTITVRDEDGCSQSASVFVEVDRNRNVFIPSAFSPNSDGVNEEFKVLTGPGVESIQFLRVYNRWGNLLFSEEDVPLNDFGQAPGWDGTFKGRLVSQGVYVYVCEVTFLDGRTLLYKGDVTVMY